MSIYSFLHILVLALSAIFIALSIIHVICKLSPDFEVYFKEKRSIPIILPRWVIIVGALALFCSIYYLILNN